MADDLAQFYAPDRPAWRGWLYAHHATAPGVWLIYYKKESGKPCCVFTSCFPS